MTEWLTPQPRQPPPLRVAMLDTGEVLVGTQIELPQRIADWASFYGSRAGWLQGSSRVPSHLHSA